MSQREAAEGALGMQRKRERCEASCWGRILSTCGSWWPRGQAFWALGAKKRTREMMATLWDHRQANDWQPDGNLSSAATLVLPAGCLIPTLESSSLALAAAPASLPHIYSIHLRQQQSPWAVHSQPG